MFFSSEIEFQDGILETICMHVHWMHSVVNHILMLSEGKPLILFGDELGRINIGIWVVVGGSNPSMWCTRARVRERERSLG